MSLFAPTRTHIACDVDLERTDDSFHAYAVPDGIDIRPGDRVRVHGMPDRLEFGEIHHFRTAATLERAGWVLRVWTELTSIFELTSLYEVGFQPDHELVLRPRSLA